jgi:hypothetical protein
MRCVRPRRREVVCQSRGKGSLQKSMDPLSLVRQFTIDHTPVNYVDGYYIFGKYRFHESTRTAFRRTHKSKLGRREEVEFFS